MNSDEKKIESNDLPGITVFDLKRCGLLVGSSAIGDISWSQTSLFSKRVVLAVCVHTFLDDDPYILITGFGETQLSQSIRLTTTKCWYGGKRYWFLCPGGNCKHYRVGKLYLLNGEFACRNCHRLTYHSRNAPDLKAFSIFNDIIVADRLRKQIGRELYRGKPTRRQRKLDELDMKILINSKPFRTGANRRKAGTIGY